MQVSAKFRGAEAVDGSTIQLLFWCPGCNTLHGPQIHGPKAWKFNGDLDKPTFEPSILVTWTSPSISHRCHSYLRDGVIEFLADCTHDLKGQKVPLPDLPEIWRDSVEDSSPPLDRAR